MRDRTLGEVPRVISGSGKKRVYSLRHRDEPNTYLPITRTNRSRISAGASGIFGTGAFPGLNTT
ncbi:hypothetical protein DSECCO2_436330 [anaerobic digester metagenome]